MKQTSLIFFRNFDHHTTSICRTRCVALTPCETCQLLGSDWRSDLLSHNQLDVFSATSLNSFIALFLVNLICRRARIVYVATNPRHPTSTGWHSTDHPLSLQTSHSSLYFSYFFRMLHQFSVPTNSIMINSLFVVEYSIKSGLNRV